MTFKLSAPVRAFAVVLGLGVLASPAFAQTAFGVDEGGLGAPRAALTVGPRFRDLRDNPDLARDNPGYFYGGARRLNSDPHSAAGTGGGAGGEGGSGGLTESPAE